MNLPAWGALEVSSTSTNRQAGVMQSMGPGTEPQLLSTSTMVTRSWVGDTVTFYNNVTVYGTPIVVWSDNTPHNRTGFGLGGDSSTIHAFVKQGILPAYPKQLGLFMGSRSEWAPYNGEIIVGGYDAARINGPLTWFPIGNRFPGLDCPLQVLLSDVTLQNMHGNQSLMSNTTTKVPACLDPIQNAFTFSDEMYAIWAALTNHTFTTNDGIITIYGSNLSLGQREINWRIDYDSYQRCRRELHLFHTT